MPKLLSSVSEASISRRVREAMSAHCRSSKKIIKGFSFQASVLTKFFKVSRKRLEAASGRREGGSGCLPSINSNEGTSLLMICALLPMASTRRLLSDSMSTSSSVRNCFERLVNASIMPKYGTPLLS